MDNLNDVTICIKSFLRFDCLKKTINDTREKYPNIKIFVADDSEMDLPELNVDKIFKFPFYTGASECKNYLIDQVNTPFIFFMDDDCIFETGGQIEKFLNAIKKYDLDIVSGLSHNLQKSSPSSIKLKDGVLYRTHWDINIKDGIPYADLLPQFFIAKTSILKNNKWDPELKTSEHLPFFLKLKQNNVNCSFIFNNRFINKQCTNSLYKKYKGSDYFNNLQEQKLNISKKIVIKNNYNKFAQKILDVNHEFR